MTNRPYAILTILVCAALLAGGCKSRQRYQVAVEGPTFGTAANAGVVVDNPRGSVTVHADDRFDFPMVEARARHAGGSFPIEQVVPPVVVEAIVTESGNRYTLRTDTIVPPERDDIFVDLIVRVPTCLGVRVRNASGPVELIGVAGTIDVENGNERAHGGTVSLKTDWALTGPTRIVTRNGDIYYAIGPGSSGLFSASTDRGRVFVRCSDGYLTDVRPTETQWSGRLNGGERQTVLETMDGDVTVTVMEGLQRAWRGYRHETVVTPRPPSELVTPELLDINRNY